MQKISYQEYTIHDFESITLSWQPEIQIFHINLKLKNSYNIYAGDADTIASGVAQLNDIFEQEVKVLHNGLLTTSYFNEYGQLHPIVLEKIQKKNINILEESAQNTSGYTSYDDGIFNFSFDYNNEEDAEKDSQALEDIFTILSLTKTEVSVLDEQNQEEGEEPWIILSIDIPTSDMLKLDSHRVKNLNTLDEKLNAIFTTKSIVLTEEQNLAQSSPISSFLSENCATSEPSLK